jgi:hypothetical protein
MLQYNKSLKQLSRDLRSLRESSISPRKIVERFRIELVKSPLTPLACLCGRKKIAKEGDRREEITHSITRRPQIFNPGV